MSQNLTLEDLAAPMRALRLLAIDFGHLPAPTVSISPIYPDRLELALHSGLLDFEAWREALDAAPGDVEYRVQGDGRTSVLRTIAAYAGAELELVGYGDIAVPVLAEAGAA
ncbi:hypothetical protein [Streptomyces sp. WM6386]|uniref:hypothetical protein n=1 Tax=Streptomyces sp. WM6386 TaxID=1415558 RepID=UPI0006198B86|nr:hypothetical protein [Streptomyces sp. WM6386]KKD04937.1 hypothetical protein TN53_27290 [Streptomyces sp. WM6386]